MLGFIKFIFITFLVLWALGILLRLAAPYILRYTAKKITLKMEEEMRRRQEAMQEQYNPQFKEEVVLNANLKVRIPRDEAEDRQARERNKAQEVDFEEIKD